jgi:hypothetical protein
MKKFKFLKMRRFWAAIGLVIGSAAGMSPAVAPVFVEVACMVAECESGA